MGGGTGGGFKGTKGSSINISDKNMHQIGKHFNKHGRDMGYSSKAEYNNAAREFVNSYQNHPDAKIYEGKWNGGGIYNNRIQRIVTYDNKTAIINPNTGQIIDFYTGTDRKGIIGLKRIR